MHLLSDKSLQVMCHELWVGEEAGAGWKRKVSGILQKIMIRRFLRMARPRVLHTSSTIYQGMLADVGFQAGLLSVFSNISDAGCDCRDWLLDQLEAARSEPSDVGVDDRFWLAGIFGTFHPGVRYDRIFARIERAAGDLGRIPVCISFGQIGRGEVIWQELRAAFADRIRFLTLGALPVSRISQILNSLEVGIAATPWDLVCKSGTVAAMLEHGLTVVTSDKAERHRIRAQSFSANVTSIDSYLAEGRHLKKGGSNKYDGLSQVAGQFLSSLKESESKAGRRGLERQHQPASS
jgi:hypothetical protein